jgi:predicted Zn-dependent protease
MRYLVCLALGSFILFACQRNAITGRSQLSFVPESEIQAQSLTAYQQFLSTSKVINTGKQAEMVKRVGSRIIKAINEYYSSQGLTSELKGYAWEVNLVDNKEMNAWCMPGGKIVVYTGLLPVTQNEDALAVVMGHEIAHALAHHGQERVSQGMLQQGLGLGLSLAVANKPAETQQIILQSYGVASQVGGILPFSRKHELEADRFGLRYAALAGYDPRSAIDLWKRMSAAGGGQKPPEILSTHPVEERRIAELQKIMPETMEKYYKPL